MMRIPERDVWPEVQFPADPAAHDETRELPLVDPRKEQFRLKLLSVFSGETCWSEELWKEAQDLGLEKESVFSWPLHTLDRVIPDEMLADLAEDFVPELGVMTERITGFPGRLSTEAAAMPRRSNMAALNRVRAV